MTNVTHISTHPDYNPGFSSAVRDAMQEYWNLRVDVERLGERMTNSPRFRSDVLGLGPEDAA